MREIGLYIHIPFCKSKCLYCDFNSYDNLIEFEDVYIEALIKELKAYLEKEELIFKTIFIGGGTPTFIKHENLYRLMEFLAYRVKEDAEITIECNPDTVNKDSAKAYRQMGINRASIGLQAIQDNLLKSIARIHSYEDFLTSYDLLRIAGFQNINVDLMFALPYQSTRMWKETLQEVCRLRPEHISCYALIVEEGTPIYESVKSGLIDLPDEDTDRDMYNIAKKILNENAYYQYEISNFSRKGFECLHNIIYWRNQDYLGIGAGSHSKLKARRFWNEKDIKKYISIINKNEIPIDAYEDIAIDEDMWETIILGLRLNEGIDFDVFKVRYSKDFMKIYGKETCELEGDGLIDINRNGIRLTEKGMDLSNIVFLKFMK